MPGKYDKLSEIENCSHKSSSVLKISQFDKAQIGILDSKHEEPNTYDQDKSKFNYLTVVFETTHCSVDVFFDNRSITQKYTSGIIFQTRNKTLRSKKVCCPVIKILSNYVLVIFYIEIIMFFKLRKKKK
jgi:hypothetical protein